MESLGEPRDTSSWLERKNEEKKPLPAGHRLRHWGRGENAELRVWGPPHQGDHQKPLLVVKG